MGLFDRFRGKSKPEAAAPTGELQRRDAVDQAIASISLEPAHLSRQQLDGYRSFSFSELAALGAGFAQITSPLRTVTSGFDIPVEGIYRAHGLGKTGRLAVSKEGFNLGTIMGKKGGFVGQTRWEKLGALHGTTTTVLPYDPTLLIVAAALHEVNSRLEEIKQIGLDILAFLEQDKEAQLRSSYSYLQEVLRNYRYNCDSDQYKSNQHIKVLDIKKDALDKLEFYRRRTEEEMAKKPGPIHTAHDVDERRKRIMKEFRNYQFSLYVYGFACFMEALLLGNFSSDYLSSVRTGIERYDDQYRELYEHCLKSLKRSVDTTVEGKALGGLQAATSFLGEASSRVGILRAMRVSDGLKGAGEGLRNQQETNRRIAEARICDVRDPVVGPFMENLRTVDAMMNGAEDILIDRDRLYIRLPA